jgi:hypothetical protein
MNIDERLENISQQLEIITGMQLAAERRFEEHERRMEEQKRRLEVIDARERKARAALLSGIAAYLSALGNGDGSQPGPA